MNTNIDTKVKRIVKIVVIHNNRLIVVKQNREGSIGYTYELPGGKVEDKEEIIDGAMRELKEETGLIANELIELGTVAIPSGDVVVTLFFTKNILGETFQELDSDECIEVITISVDEALRKVISGEWKDSRLGIGLIWARARRLL